MTEKRAKVIVEYVEGGRVVSDFEVKNEIRRLKMVIDKAHLSDTPYVRDYANELMIHALRAEIHDGTIDHNDIIFKYGDLEQKADKNGRLERWPIGFCDAYEQVFSRMLDPMHQDEE